MTRTFSSIAVGSSLLAGYLGLATGCSDLSLLSSNLTSSGAKNALLQPQSTASTSCHASASVDASPSATATSSSTSTPPPVNITAFPEVSGATIDQSQPEYRIGNGGITPDETWGQTFVPSKSGTLVAVALRIAKPQYVPASDLGVAIKNITGEFTPDGSLLGAATVSVASLPSSLDQNWVLANFSNGVPLTGGTKYAIVLSTATGAVNFGFSYAATYPSGEGIFIYPPNGITIWTKSESTLAFATYLKN